VFDTPTRGRAGRTLRTGPDVALLAKTSSGAILSTTFNAKTRTNGWGYKQGTSMSSPHAAGVAALALSAHPRLTAGSLASFLERTATALACPEGVYDPFPQFPQYQSTCAGGDARNSFYGAGNVNAFAAVR
jgi:subtilisin family serine protease